ncbi:MAG: AAA family ATPase, partial [Nocardioidaceae bacterium]
MLFADLVSYTALSESRDTDDVRDLLTEYFEVCKTVVRRYGGTIEKFIGDAVMAVWGVPAAHEDDAERAVRAAIELVTSVAELGEELGLPGLALRAGVVTGEVSTTIGATDQGMVAGDAVNTAARVQSAAASGEVWVDANTRALTAAAVSYTDAGEHELKGKAEPVRLFKAGSVVASLGGSRRLDGLEAPVVGRDRYLRLLKELFHATEESGRPLLVVLDGEAGVGKSRLAWEFEKYIDGLSTTVVWIRGRCWSYGEGAAFGALAAAVRSSFTSLGYSTDTVPDGALDEALEAYVPDEEERDWMRPRLASLLRQGSHHYPREELFSAWTRYFERLGRGVDPVVLLINDAQHADDGLLDFLDHLVGSARMGIFVLLLARPELLARRSDLGGRRSTVIPLEPLPDLDMSRLVDELVHGLPSAARDELVARTEGIPLYAVETVRALIDRGLVQETPDGYEVTPGRELDLSSVEAPASLHALVAARLDALTPPERRVVTDASVLGLTFTEDGIQALNPTIENLDQILSSLHRKQIISVESDRSSAERVFYRFMQSVVRQVAYATLSRRDRKSRHLAVAAHLAARPGEAEELAAVTAQHLIDAIEASNEGDADVPELERQAGDLLGQAGARACSLGSSTDGLRLFKAALAHLTDLAARAELQEQAAAAAVALMQFDTAFEMASAALAARETVGDPVAEAPAAVLKAQTLALRGELSAAIEILQPRYHALLEGGGSESARLRIATALSKALWDAGEYDAMRTILRDCVLLAEQLDSPAALAAAMNLMGSDQLLMGSSRISFALFRDLAELSREHGLWAFLVAAEINLSGALLPYSAEEGVHHARAALTAAQKYNLSNEAEIATASLALALWTTGEWSELADLLSDYLDSSDNHVDFSLELLDIVDLWCREAGLARIMPPNPPSRELPRSLLLWEEHLLMLRAIRAGDLAAAAAHAKASVDLATIETNLSDDFMHVWPMAVWCALAAQDLP